MTWLGQITFSDGDTKVAYHVFGVEKGQAHLCMSFMDYLGMFDELVACHKFYYDKLLNEKKTIRIDDQQVKCIDVQKTTKVLS